MSRRVWTGVVAGVLAGLVMVSLAGAAYRAGERHEVVTRAVGDGQVVRVVGDYGWGYGHGGFFFLFPLLGILLVFLLLRSRRGYWGGGYWGGGYSGGGPRPCGPGHGVEGGPDAAFEAQHRRAHDRAGPDPAEREA